MNLQASFNSHFDQSVDVKNQITQIENTMQIEIRKINNNFVSVQQSMVNEVNINISNVRHDVTQQINTEINSVVTNVVHNEINHEIKSIQNTLVKQVKNQITNQHIHVGNNISLPGGGGGSDSSSPCCPDCTEPNFRVPSESECAINGCSDGCAYQNSTCDVAGEEKEDCIFPFTYMGITYTTCAQVSDHGETKRPWCYLE